jgi:hypothetical protein
MEQQLHSKVLLGLVPLLRKNTWRCILMLLASALTFSNAAFAQCSTPTALLANSITANSASLNWTQAGTAVGWQIKYGAPGFSPATAGTAVYTTSKPYTLNGLLPTTGYDYYVRAVCAVGDTSAWSVVKNFTTLCLAPAILSKKDSNRCGSGEVQLNATADQGASIRWYSAATGGTLLGTGSTFTTPVINTTTNYYVAAASGSGGQTNHSIATLTGGGNGCGGGVMFDITPTVDITVDSFLNLSGQTQTTTVTVYYKTGTHVGFELNAAAWTTLGTATISTTSGVMAPVNVGAGIAMTAGNTYGIFIANMYSSYTNGTGPNQVFTNADLTLNAGTGLCGVWTSTTNFPRVFNGTVYYHKGSACESPRQQVTATVYPNPVVNIGNDTTICPGVSYTFNAGNPGASYEWNTNATTQSITTNAAGNYSVLVTDTNGCTGSDAVLVTAGIVPVNNLAPVTNLCEGDIASLNAGNSGSAFLWSPGNQVTQVVNVSNPGIYSVQIRSIHGCVITSTTDLIVRPLPVPNLIGDTSICDGDHIVLDAGNPGYTFQWSNGATTQTITAADSGTYSVTVTTPYDCENTEEMHIAYLPSPRVEGFNFIPYFHEELGKVKFAPINPSHVHSYRWDFGDNSAPSTLQNPIHTFPPGSGDYLVTLTVFNDCGSYDISLPIHVDIATGLITAGRETAHIVLYPNPAKSTLHIELNSADIHMKEVSVFNILGAQVYQSKLQDAQQHDIHLDALASGIYSVRIQTDKGFIMRKFEVVK